MRLDVSERCIKLFRIGEDQVLEIPPEFELLCDAVILRKEGDRLILEPRQLPRTEKP